MEIKLILCPEDLIPFVPRLALAKAIAVDAETTGLNPHTAKIRLVQLAAEGLPVLIIDCFSFLPHGRALLHDILSYPAVKVFQNAKFDLQFLMALQITPRPLFDTMLAAQLLYMPGLPRRADLRTLVGYYLNEELDKEEQKSDWSGVLTKAQLQYAARDAEILLRLRKAMIPLLLKGRLVRTADIEFRCVRAVAQMEYHGIYLELPKWQALLDKTLLERKRALEALYAYTGRPLAQMTLWGEDQILDFNFDSNPFILNLLHQNNIPVMATAKPDLFLYRDNPLVAALSEYRKASKSVSSFLQPIPTMLEPATGRLHPKYGQISAFSGRMSCSNPNIQQIPRSAEFRACFTAPKGRCLIVADYPQIELRVAAQISKDERMLAAYQAGEDLHLLTASLLLNKPMNQIEKQERQAAKAVNFGLIFGMGAAGLQQYAQQSYGVEMTLDMAVEFRRRFFKAYQGIDQWHQSLKRHHESEGRTLTGRRFAFSKTAGLPELSNSPVQGTAADIVKKALGLLANRLEGTDSYIAAVVHDEILMECPKANASCMAELLKLSMEEAANEILPLALSRVEAKISESWAEK